MSDYKVILFCCESLERFNFIERLARPLKDKAILITTEPLVKILSFMRGFECRYVHKRSNGMSQKTQIEAGELETTIEVLNGAIKIDDARIWASSIEKVITEGSFSQIEKVVVWNGQQLLGKVIANYSRNMNIPTLFMELSNLPGKIFVDHKGVNAQSSIDNFTDLPKVDDKVHCEWLVSYNKYKRSPPPQSKINQKKRILSALNLLIKEVLFSRNIHPRTLFENKVGFEYETMVYDLEGGKYIFIPLQVSGDTQIKINSKYDNIDLLRYGSRIANELSFDVVVKIHPAENNINEINRIIDLSKELGFIISSQNTIDLLVSSEKVITINSTVGLEAMIFGKETEVIGNAFYSDFTSDDLLKYIHYYLIDGVDYFSSEPIELSKTIEILDRAK